MCTQVDKQVKIAQNHQKRHFCQLHLATLFSIQYRINHETRYIEGI